MEILSSVKGESIFMSQKKEKKINLNELTEEELLKYLFQGDRKNRRYGQPKEEGEKRRKVIRKRSQGKRGNI